MAKSKTKSDTEAQNTNTPPTESNATSKPEEIKSSVPDEPQNETPSSNDDSKQEENSSGRGATFWLILGVGGSIGLCVLLFVVAIIVGVASGRWENVANVIAIVRDLMIILLVLEGILIGVALIFMILQLSLLLNVLQNEIKPILENAQQAASTVKGTATFVSKQVTSPIIRVKSTIAGTRAFLSGFRDLRSMTTKSSKKDQKEDDEKKEPKDNSPKEDKAK